MCISVFFCQAFAMGLNIIFLVLDLFLEKVNEKVCLRNKVMGE